MTMRALMLWIGVVIATSLGLYLIGNDTFSLWDRDEPRYAQCSREMLQSGDWIVPRLYGVPRTAKPPLIYWLQASAMRELGQNASAARLPSAIAMALTLLLLATVLWRFVGAAEAFWTVFILASSILTIVTAKAALTDSVLVLWITSAQLCFYATWRGRGGWLIVIVMATATGLAGLTKGPVVLGIMAMTGLALIAMRFIDAALEQRTWTPALHFGAIRGAAVGPALAKVGAALLIVAAICAPWLWLVHHRSPPFLGASIGHDVLKRILTGLEGHRGPPGYHLLTIWGTFLPWSLLLPLALALAWKHRDRPPVRFALAAVVGPWIMFEIVQTKLPHYLLPLFPPLAFLTAHALLQTLRGVRSDLINRGFMRAVTAWCVVILLLGVVPWLAYRFRPFPLGITALVSVLAMVWASVVYILFRQQRPARAAVAMGVGAMVACAVLFTLYLPRANFLRLSILAADVLKENGATGPGEAIMLDYKEPSLAFYQGGTIREGRETSLPDDPPDRWPKWVVVTGKMWDEASPRARSHFEAVGPRLHGLSYADGGRVLDVMVLRRRGEAGG